ncbi:hypothetical protein PIB30_021742 [Stylosanthes scabra]|uniref:Uncharacterized protein n=1 Tax=Stylosanthes scabra TaxID=79078 RepID=A0ABU6TB06_9FABA|nr:hypothetical protein [Stylosanthes scabra]
MEDRPIEEIATEDRRETYRLNGISHVAHNVHAEKDGCIVTVRRQIGMGLDPRAEPVVQRAGLLPVARLTERWFKIDEPLISAFREVAIGDSFVPHAMGRVHHHPRGCRVPAGSPHRRRAYEWLPLGLREHDARWYREIKMGLVPGDVWRATRIAGRD